MTNSLERRLELLKLEAEGFSQPEVVKDLSQKYECSVRTIYRDYETRHIWQPFLSEWTFDEQLLTTLNRYEGLYRKASLLTHDNNPLVRLGAIRTCFVIQKELFELRHLGVFDQEGRRSMLKDGDNQERLEKVASEVLVEDQPIKAVLMETKNHDTHEETPQIPETQTN